MRTRPVTHAASLLAAATLLVALTACAGTPTPTPSSTRTASATPGASPSTSPHAEQEQEETPDAAVVVVTASGISVFGTDGSTLASVTYVTDAAIVAGQLAEALDEEAIVTHPEAPGSCPASTIYGFGGLALSSPGGLGSAGSVGSGDLYDAYVSSATTSGGVAIETVAGQRVGSTRAAFEAAVGDEMQFEQYGPDVYGFDIVNPEAGPYDLIGILAWFEGDRLSAWSAPAAVGFVGDCG
jgi:hypothetical protein